MKQTEEMLKDQPNSIDNDIKLVDIYYNLGMHYL